jgi:hypothetical protein
MKEYGNKQGDMSPSVRDYQKPESNYSQNQFGSTLRYVERQDKIQNKEASAIKKQAYDGRYS